MYKINKWLSRKAVNFLVKSSDKYHDMNRELTTIFDTTDFSNIEKCSFIYLGGGIDAVTDLDKNWRYWFEEQFSEEHVLSREDSIKLSTNGSWKGVNKTSYKTPMLFNPLRNEVIRDNEDFIDAYNTFKSGGFDNTDVKDDTKLKILGKYFHNNVQTFDLNSFALCDTNFVKIDATAGAGTLGELQLSILLKQNIILWVDSDMDREQVRLNFRNI